MGNFTLKHLDELGNMRSVDMWKLLLYCGYEEIIVVLLVSYGAHSNHL